MRIVGGLAGGIPLRVPRGRDVRPTEDRVKESVFGTLGCVEGAAVLDLFAGTGALGLEALSRGADSVVFVERNPRVVKILKQNLAAVVKALGPGAGSARVLALPVARACPLLAGEAQRFDVVFADPPYRPTGGEMGAAALLESRGVEALASVALLVLEHPEGVSLPWAPVTAWRLVRQKTYSGKIVSFARLASVSPAG